MSRKSRRRERDRRRNGIRKNKRVRTDEEDEVVFEAERGSSQEGGEESGKVLDEEPQGLDHVEENSVPTVKKPYINQAQLEALHSDDMSKATFHLTTPDLPENTPGPSQEPSGENISSSEKDPIDSMNISQLLDHMRNTHAKLLNVVSRHSVDNADNLARNRDSMRIPTPDSMPSLEEISEEESLQYPEDQPMENPVPVSRIVYDAESDKYFQVSTEGEDEDIVRNEERDHYITPFDPFPQANQRVATRAASEPRYTGADSVFDGWDVPVHKYYLRTMLAPTVPSLPCPNPFNSVRVREDMGGECRICGLIHEDPGMEIDFPNTEGDVELRSVCSYDIFGGPDSTFTSDEEEMQVDHEGALELDQHLAEYSGFNVRTVMENEDLEDESTIERRVQSAIQAQFRAVQSVIGKLLGCQSAWLDFSATKLVKNPNHPSSMVMRDAINNMMQGSRKEIVESIIADLMSSELIPGFIPSTQEDYNPPTFPSTVPRYFQYASKLKGLRFVRKKAYDIVVTITNILKEDDWDKMYQSRITVLYEDGDNVREEEVDITDFFRKTGLNENAFLFEYENHFLRRAAERFRIKGRQDIYDALNDVLRIKVPKAHMVRILLKGGYLEETSNDHAAMHLLWGLENFD
jgi:hypothetical protein